MTPVNQSRMICMTLLILGAGAAASLAQLPSPTTAFGSTAPLRRPDPSAYGNSATTLVNIGFSDFLPMSSDMTWTIVNGPSGSSPGLFFSSPHLPTGVQLTYFELDYCDTSPTGDVFLTLVECSYDGTACEALSSLNSSTGASGCGYVAADLTPLNHTINNFSKRLQLQVTAVGSQRELVGAYIGYKLQVSPAPPSATFLDVPTTHPYFRFVEALADAGITGGCGGNNYCVDSPITRGEMAVFLAAALGLHFPN
jgi:S-layer homology domain